MSGPRSDPGLGAGASTPVILVVDDEPAIVRATAQALRMAGYTVATAADGEDAIGVAATLSRIDLLLTDIMMPRLDGPALVARLQRTWPDLRVLYMSAYPRRLVEPATGQETEETKETGTTRPPQLLEKPFSLGDLLDRVRAVLA